MTSVAHTYFLLGDYARTLEWYPPGLRYYLDAAALATAGRESDAAELLRERVFLAPMVDSLRFSLAGDHARSIEIVKSTLQRRPSPEPELKFYLARHLARDGERQLANQGPGRPRGGGILLFHGSRPRPVAHASRECAGLCRSPGSRAPARKGGTGGFRGGRR